MPGITIGGNRPPESAPSYKALTDRSGESHTSRWTGRSCDFVPDGEIFIQKELGDRDRYTQAGCTHMGAQPVRHFLTLSSTRPDDPLFSTTFIDAWCCQQPQVVDVFNTYVQSPEYLRKRYWGLAFAAVMLLGGAYLFINREKWSGKLHSRQRVSWAANPYDEEDWDWEEDDDE